MFIAIQINQSGTQTRSTYKVEQTAKELTSTKIVYQSHIKIQMTKYFTKQEY